MTTGTHFTAARKYGTILADPPWSFRNWSAKGTGCNAISHYDCIDFTAGSLAMLTAIRLASSRDRSAATGRT